MVEIKELLVRLTDGPKPPNHSESLNLPDVRLVLIKLMLPPSLEHTCCLKRTDVKFTRVHVPPQVDADFYAAGPQHSDPLMLFSWFE